MSVIGLIFSYFVYRHWSQRRAQQRMQEELSTILCDYMPLSGWQNCFLLVAISKIIYFQTLNITGLEMDELNSKRAGAKLREALV